MSPELAIRPMQLQDIPGLAQWIANTSLWQRYGVTKTSMSERFRAGFERGATIYVAEQGREVLGFIWLVERGAFDRSGYVELVGVRPGERRQGVGRALMEFAERRTLAQSVDLFLLVSDFNVEAQQFYEKLGFRQVGALPDYVVSGVTELVYWKRPRT